MTSSNPCVFNVSIQYHNLNGNKLNGGSSKSRGLHSIHCSNPVTAYGHGSRLSDDGIDLHLKPTTTTNGTFRFYSQQGGDWVYGEYSHYSVSKTSQDDTITTGKSQEKNDRRPGIPKSATARFSLPKTNKQDPGSQYGGKWFKWFWSQASWGSIMWISSSVW